MAESMAEQKRFFSRKNVGVALPVLPGEDLNPTLHNAGITDENVLKRPGHRWPDSLHRRDKEL